ncbi:hypothetical protein RND71_032041 [Anisodus tanguticus]|uniref:Uncharacterized protein n=1 Tax=Anisodus tanguticus TaxID=243964 RepID=A0AAE1V3T4_9SOLA|nr:hypothetical protein RND71_032041 [Anisodus tanguticus]
MAGKEFDEVSAKPIQCYKARQDKTTLKYLATTNQRVKSQNPKEKLTMKFGLINEIVFYIKEYDTRFMELKMNNMIVLSRP